MSTATTVTYKENVTVLEGTLLVKSSFELPAKAKTSKRAAVPARTMGVIGVVDGDGTYHDVTDFSASWKGLSIDEKYRFVVDKQTRSKGGRTNTYLNLKRAMPLAAVPTAEAQVPAEA